MIKVNQIGTLTETLDAIDGQPCRVYSGCIPPFRETEDATIADLVVAVNAGQIKTGALHAPTCCKYNQLLRIEEQLDDLAQYPGLNAWFNLKNK